MTPPNPIETFEAEASIYEELFGDELRNCSSIQPMKLESGIENIFLHLNYRPEYSGPGFRSNFGFLNLGVGVESQNDPDTNEALYLVRFEITPPDSWPISNLNPNVLYAMPIVAKIWHNGDKQIITYGRHEDHYLFEVIHHTAIVQTVADSLRVPVVYGVQQSREGEFGNGFSRPYRSEQFSHSKVFFPNS